MATLNRWEGIGRLGKDPEFTVTTNGTPVAKFSFAVEKRGKDREGNATKETLWLNIVAWNKLAEIVEKYAHRGSQIWIEGRLDIRGYTDKEGTKRQAVEIIAEKVEFLDGKPSATASSTTASSAHASASSGSNEFDPFLDSDELP